MPLRIMYCIGASVFAETVINTDEVWEARKDAQNVLQLTWPGVRAYVFRLEQVCS